MEYTILVDGYNVIKNNMMFQYVEQKNLAAARELLLKQLKNRYRQTTHRVVVVFDGNDQRERMHHEEHIRVIFSRYGETADRVIARLAAEARQRGQAVLLYSDDSEVKESVAEQGGNVSRTTYQLTTHLNAPPRDVAIRAYHRQAMRRAYGIDPSYKPDDELEPHHQPTKKKKKSSKRYR